MRHASRVVCLHHYPPSITAASLKLSLFLLCFLHTSACPRRVCISLQVDAGSDDEQALLSDLPPTEAAAAAADRAARQQPLLALSRGYTGRRVTQGDDREQYDDAAEAAAGGVPSPRWDLHSVAESMQQVGRGAACVLQLSRCCGCRPDSLFADTCACCVCL